MEYKYFASAPDQEYTKEFLKQILGEDDGYLFSYDHPIRFDLYWTDGLIKQLEDAKKYWNKIKDTYKYDGV